ncbi:TetR/AcrR family transcriptional regulator [Clavibacter sp. VKM Ac-2542]|uniref:TetR/AcrR family transcriptional regulator n=1 Tax=Clavibacter sp. VKM Ac-2542 TaxID=2783811 RepID=UPI00188B0182|nr:TetR/AcrR family transcriptional regulator [Clavibacter sp. VKM Ac-2542]MBF4621438.1 TetR/AcrR family transcriptional regulator [Clavibacter sp. VKM Ac-2542]
MSYETQTTSRALPKLPLSDEDELQRPERGGAATRRALVGAARRRFATDGYRATTVRQIAGDAGVNVALINRYFESKEGLFEACMLCTFDELEVYASPRAADLDGLIDRLITHVANTPDEDDPLQLLLLLRSSGDENADRIRRRTLEHFTQSIARAAGWIDDDARTASILLRAQLTIATMTGVVMLRTSAAVQPVATATAEELSGPLARMFRTLLTEHDV